MRNPSDEVPDLGASPRKPQHKLTTESSGRVDRHASSGQSFLRREKNKSRVSRAGTYVFETEQLAMANAIEPAPNAVRTLEKSKAESRKQSFRVRRVGMKAGRG